MPDFKQSVIYQIYPRSFNDADGDGVGDLAGIIQKLDYLHDLGVDVLWLSPIFQSPNADNGYDVSDYEAIMTEFGTMDDFNELLAGVHKRGMKLILDLVVNHSSDEHRWFQESRKSKDNPYRDYYIWQGPSPPASLHLRERGVETGGSASLSRRGRGTGAEGLPNNWLSFFSGPAWKLDELTGEYYLHLFAEKQPDLNWENPELRAAVYRMMRVWLDKGVDGFRMDVIPFLSKAYQDKGQTLPDYPEGRYGDLTIYANGPRIHEFLREMNREVLSQYPCMSVGEGFGVSADQANLYVGEDRHELNMIYHFDHAVPRDENRLLERAPEFTLIELKAIFAKWDAAVGDTGWQNIYFGNHDNPRVISRFGDPERFHYESATMLATILLTQRGTPSIYQGDELGMTNCPFDAVEEYDDIQIKNAWQTLQTSPNFSPDRFQANASYMARDHARTPMQWYNGRNAGFTSGKPWLKVNPNYDRINVADQQVRDDSVLSFYKKLLRWRKKTPAIWAGTYRDLLPDHPTIWVYERQLDDVRLLVLANFSNQPVPLPEGLASVVLLSNYGGDPAVVQPFEARIVLLDN